MALHGSLVSGAKYAVCCGPRWGSGGRLFGERHFGSVWAVLCRRKDFEWAYSLSRIDLRDFSAFFSKFGETMVSVK